MTEVEANGHEATGEQELQEDSMYSERDQAKAGSRGPKIQVTDDAMPPSSSHTNPAARTTKNAHAYDTLNEHSLENSRSGDPLGTVSQYPHSSRLNPLRLAANLPKPRFKLTLDNEERDLVLKHKHLNKDQIWAMLEKKRFQELQNNAINLQSDMLANIRCPKCTLLPPCAHYKNEAQLLRDAPGIVHSSKFKDAVPATKRENLMRIIKQQQKELAYARQVAYDSQDEDGAEGSPARAGSTEPKAIRHTLLVPEKDYEFDSAMKFRRKTLADLAAQEPQKQIQRDFLRRGGGNGGSPTQFDTGLKDNRTLVPIMRQVKQPTMRIRTLQGYETMEQVREGSAGRERSLSPGQKQEIERKKRIQQQIAEYREMKMRQERERIAVKDKELAEEKAKLIKIEGDRRKFMNQYKTKLRQEQSVLQVQQQSMMEESKMTATKNTSFLTDRKQMDVTPVRARKVQPITHPTSNSKQKVNPMSHSHVPEKPSPKPVQSKKQKDEAAAKLRDFQAKKAKAEEMLLVGGGNTAILPKPVEPPVQAGASFLPMDSEGDQYTQEEDEDPSGPSSSGQQQQNPSPTGDRYGGSAEENYTLDDSEQQTKPASAVQQPAVVDQDQEDEDEEHQPTYTDDYENDDE